MASHGKSRHMKRIAAPRAVRIARKENQWVKKPVPGPHKKAEGIALGVLLRDTLKIADDMPAAKKLLNEGSILVDGKPVKDPARPVGFMDIIGIPKLKKSFRILLSGGMLKAVEITDAEAKVKLCKIANKKMVGKGRIQLCLHDGRNYMIEKEEDVFGTGATVRLKVPEQKAEGFLKLEKGAACYVSHGKHSGELGTLEEILERAGSRATEARLDAGGKKIITLKNYLFVVDKGFKA